MKLLINSIIGATLVTGASAATISFSDSVSVTESGTLQNLNTLSLSKFDTSLGTLTKVEVTITLSVPSFTVVVDNDSENAANVTVGFGTLGSVLFETSASTWNGSNTLSGSNFSITTQSSTFNVGAQDSDPVDSFHNDSGPDNGSFTTTVVNVGQLSPRVIHSSVWGDYSGAGYITYDIALDLVTNLNLNSGGGPGLVRFEGAIPSATYSAQVTYTYDAIPEPSAAALAGLGALALLRRRRP